MYLPIIHHLAVRGFFHCFLTVGQNCVRVGDYKNWTKIKRPSNNLSLCLLLHQQQRYFQHML